LPPLNAGANRFAGFSPTPLAVLAAYGQIPMALRATPILSGTSSRNELSKRDERLSRMSAAGKSPVRQPAGPQKNSLDNSKTEQ
jgi:hypothetical protein